MKPPAIGNSTQHINQKIKMKHTELYNEYKKLDELERQELIAAVKAHGGEYVFIDEEDEDWYDDDDAPIVCACFSYSDGMSDYYVSRVAVDDKGYLSIYGFDKEYGSPSDERELYQIETGHIGPIIDCIPATETVKDVSSSIFAPQPILVFSREDVENVGYSQDMTSDQYKALVRAMKKSYEWNMDIYWDALRQACENVGITPLNSFEDDEEN